MSLICGFLESLWTKFYNTCVRGVSSQTRYMIGGAIILCAIILFVACTKGSKKGEMVGNWFLFWVSMVCLIAGVYYISI